MKILTIDPGLRASNGGTGWCLAKQGVLLPERTGILKSTLPEWETRADDICLQFSKIIANIRDHCVKHDLHVYVEFPAMFQTVKGMACATGKDGDDSSLVKLAFLAGRLYEVAVRETPFVGILRVNDWKGTLPKDVVKQRVASRLGIKVDKWFPYVEDEIDAVGMSLCVQGVFKANEGESKAPTKNTTKRNRVKTTS